MRGRLYWWLAALVLTGVAVAGGVLIYRASLERKKAGAAAKPAPAPVPAGEVTIAGTIEAAEFIDVAPPLEGVVDALEVEPGEEVFEGQLLARIRNQTLNSERDRSREDANRAQERVQNLDSSVIAARLEASRAAADATRVRGEFEQAERVALREQALLREGATPRQKHDKAQKEFQAARVEYEALRDKAKASEERVSSLSRELDLARKTLDEKNRDLEDAEAALQAADLLAPADGVVVAVKAAAGDEVTPALADFIRISTDTSRLLLVVEPEPAVLSRIKPGLPALIQVAEAPEGIEGAVREIKELRVLVEFASPSPATKPGMTAHVKIKLP